MPLDVSHEAVLRRRSLTISPCRGNTISRASAFAGGIPSSTAAYHLEAVLHLHATHMCVVAVRICCDMGAVVELEGRLHANVDQAGGRECVQGWEGLLVKMQTLNKINDRSNRDTSPEGNLLTTSLCSYSIHGTTILLSIEKPPTFTVNRRTLESQ